MANKKEEPVVVYRGDGFNLKLNEDNVYFPIVLEYPVAGCWYDGRLCVSSKEYPVEGMTKYDIEEEQNYVQGEEWGWAVNFKSDAVVYDYDYPDGEDDFGGIAVDIINPVTKEVTRYDRLFSNEEYVVENEHDTLYEAFVFNLSNGEPVKFLVGYVRKEDLL